VTDRLVAFSTLMDKARWLDAAASLDATGLKLRGVAHRLQRRAELEHGASRAALARELHRFARDEIRYVRDRGRGPSGEQFADSETIVARGYDDCDGKSRLFVALCRVVGLEAHIRAIFPHPGQFRHVQAEVRWPGSQREPLAGPGGWLLAELILKGCELGQSPDDVPRGPRGERVLTR
jgi:transglutaminase-like putative cysteine protease